MDIPHFVSGSCKGEKCRICGIPATHKVGEEIQHDDPNPERHNLTAYLCCTHYRLVVGPAAPCASPEPLVAMRHPAEVCGNCAGTGRSLCASCDGRGYRESLSPEWYAWMLARSTCPKPHGEMAACDSCKALAEKLIGRAKAR